MAATSVITHIVRVYKSVYHETHTVRPMHYSTCMCLYTADPTNLSILYMLQKEKKNNIIATGTSNNINRGRGLSTIAFYDAH